MASFARRGCVDGFFVSTKRGIAVVRLDGGFVRCLDDIIGIRRERFPFVSFIDIGDARAGGATSRREHDGGDRACRPVLGREPIEAEPEHRDVRDAQPDQHKGRGMRDHGNS
ncbi:hypothetical protein WJ79_30885 [Burkholderia ubonensis]|nr:hypothetical protein WJ79_30885 [Burkholderia ubonensis]